MMLNTEMMQRKKLIKPITIVKVQKFLKQVRNLTEAGGDFSIDKLTREHSLGSTTGKAMVELGMIARNEEGTYIIGEKDFGTDKYEAVQLIEKVRVMNIERMENKSFIKHSGEAHSIKLETGRGDNKEPSGEEDIHLNRKALKTPEIALILDKIFSKMNEGKQSDIFNGIDNLHNERIHVASAISAGVWGSIGIGQDFPRMSEEAIREINAKIVFTASDLMDQTLNYKKVNK